MIEVACGGNKIYAAIETLARLSKLSRRHCDRLIKGYFEKRTGERVKGFLERGILTQIAKPGEKKRTAIYLFHEQALHDAPALQGDIEKAGQMDLPEIVKPPKPEIPFQPISDESPKVPGLWMPGTPSNDAAATTPPLVGHGVQYVKTSIVDTVSSPLVGHGVHPRLLDTVSSPLVGHGVHRFKSYESNPIESNPIESQPGTGTDSKRGVCTILPSDDSPQIQTFENRVREIANLHPKIYDAFNLPTDSEEFKAIVAAIERDHDFVLVGTTIMAEQVAKWTSGELQYLSSVVNFFRRSEYRRDAAAWKRKEEHDNKAERLQQQNLEVNARVKQRLRARAGNA